MIKVLKSCLILVGCEYYYFNTSNANAVYHYSKNGPCKIIKSKKYYRFYSEEPGKEDNYLLITKIKEITRGF